MTEVQSPPRPNDASAALPAPGSAPDHVYVPPPPLPDAFPAPAPSGPSSEVDIPPPPPESPRDPAPAAIVRPIAVASAQHQQQQQEGAGPGCDAEAAGAAQSPRSSAASSPVASPREGEAGSCPGSPTAATRHRKHKSRSAKSPGAEEEGARLRPSKSDVLETLGAASTAPQVPSSLSVASMIVDDKQPRRRHSSRKSGSHSLHVCDDPRAAGDSADGCSSPDVVAAVPEVACSVAESLAAAAEDAATHMLHALELFSAVEAQLRERCPERSGAAAGLPAGSQSQSPRSAQGFNAAAARGRTRGLTVGDAREAYKDTAPVPAPATPRPRSSPRSLSGGALTIGKNRLSLAAAAAAAAAAEAAAALSPKSPRSPSGPPPPDYVPPPSTPPPPEDRRPPPPPPPMPGAGAAVAVPSLPVSTIDRVFRGVQPLREAVAATKKILQAQRAKTGRAGAADFPQQFFDAYAALLDAHVGAVKEIDRASSGCPALRTFFLQKRKEFKCKCMWPYDSIEQALGDSLIWSVPELSEVLHIQCELETAHNLALRVLSTTARRALRPAFAEKHAEGKAREQAAKRALSSFGDLVGRVTMLAYEVEAYELLRGIAGDVPPSDMRAFVREGVAWLQVSRDVGVSRDAPCRLVLFTDGLAVTALNTTMGTTRVWALVLWIALEHVIKVEMTAAPLGFRVRHLSGAHAFLVSTADECKQWIETLSEEAPKPSATTDAGQSIVTRVTSAKVNQGAFAAVVAASVAARRNTMAVTGLEVAYGGQKPPLFGGSLQRIVAHMRMEIPDLRVPLFVSRAVKYIVSDGLREEGLFRQSGQHGPMGELRLRLPSEDVRDLARYGIHSVATTLKAFLRELAEPVLTYDLYDEFMRVPEISSDQDKVSALQTLIARLPEPNRDLLREILSLFYQVVSNKHANRMGFENCAIVMAPNLLWRRKAGGGGVGGAADAMATLADAEDISAISTINDLGRVLLENFMLLFEESQPTPADPLIFRRKVLISRHVSPVVAILSPTASPSAPPTQENRVWLIDETGVVSIWDAGAIEFMSSVSLPGGNVRACALVGTDVWVLALPGIWIIDSLKPAATSNPSIDSSLLGCREVPKPSAFCVGKGGKVWVGCGQQITAFSSRAPHEVLATIRPRCHNETTQVTALACCGDRVWASLCSSGIDAVICVFNGATGELLMSTALQHTSVTSLVNMGVSVWARVSPSTICVIDAETGALSATLSPPASQAAGTAEQQQTVNLPFTTTMSRFMGQVWSAGGNDSVHIWDGDNCAYIGELHGYHAAVPSALALIGPPQRGGDSRWHTWVGATDGSAVVWEVDAGWISLALPAKFASSPRYAKSNAKLAEGHADEMAPRVGRGSRRSATLRRCSGGEYEYENESSEERIQTAVKKRSVVITNPADLPALASGPQEGPTKRESEERSMMGKKAVAQVEAAAAEAAQSQPEVHAKHSWKQSSLKTAGACKYCHKPLLGLRRNSVTCTACRIHVHRACAQFVTDIPCTKAS
eukprot:m51a1_g5620 hypothetical protein (1508) ;mRNA; r:762677-767341